MPTSSICRWRSSPRRAKCDEAVARLADLDLVLMDTAGRSPRTRYRIQELKSMLTEAQPDEVHLVLSSVAERAGAGQDCRAVRRGGTTA